MMALLHLVLGAIAGGLTCTLHLWLLWRGLARLNPHASPAAARWVMRSLPLRLLVWAPACLLAAQLGLWGCIGLVVGSATLRWWMTMRALRNMPVTMARLR